MTPNKPVIITIDSLPENITGLRLNCSVKNGTQLTLKAECRIKTADSEQTAKQHKLTITEKTAIRETIAKGTVSKRALARQFGVSERTIRRISAGIIRPTIKPVQKPAAETACRGAS